MEKDAGLRSRPLFTGVVLAVGMGTGKSTDLPTPQRNRHLSDLMFHLLSVKKKRTQPMLVFSEQNRFL